MNINISEMEKDAQLRSVIVDFGKMLDSSESSSTNDRKVRDREPNFVRFGISFGRILK